MTIDVIYTSVYKKCPSGKIYTFRVNPLFRDILHDNDLVISPTYLTPMQVVDIRPDDNSFLKGDIAISELKINKVKRWSDDSKDTVCVWEIPYKECELGSGRKLIFKDIDPPLVENKPLPSNGPVTDSSLAAGINALLETAVGNGIEEIMKKVYPEIEQKIRDNFGFLPQVHKVVTDSNTVEIKEALHEKFDQVLAIVQENIPVYLTGKAGTGKNVLCKQIATVLDLDFYFTNAVTQEYKLTGFIDANGIYHETQFYKAFVNGGLFFLDEIDASIPETLVILNAAIANKYFDFPTGKIEAHPNFRVIAAGNTKGLGADNEYTGRYTLDEASLDRFAMIEIDYSLEIENNLSKGDKDLVSFAHVFRLITEEAGIKCLFSYRTIERIAKLKNCEHFTLQEVLRISLLKGLDVDDINVIKKELTGKGWESNSYTKALLAL